MRALDEITLTVVVIRFFSPLKRQLSFLIYLSISPEFFFKFFKFPFLVIFCCCGFFSDPE